MKFFKIGLLGVALLVCSQAAHAWDCTKPINQQSTNPSGECYVPPKPVVPTVSHKQSQKQKQHQTQSQSQVAKGGNAKQSQSVKNSGNATLADVGNSSAVASADNSGNNVGSGNVTDVNVQGATYRAARIPVATAYAASLTSGMDTCLGSASGGLQTAPVGVSIGGTKVDKNCVLIKQVQLLLELRQERAACFRARRDPDIDQSYRDAGVDCPSLVPEVPEVQLQGIDTSRFVTKEELKEHEDRIFKKTVTK